MAVVFADPFGSYIEGYERGQEAEIEYQEHALSTFDSSLNTLDKFVLEPQRQLAKEQRQYARQLDLMMQRHTLARRRNEERELSREDTGRIGSIGSGGLSFYGPGSARPAPAPAAAPTLPPVIPGAGLSYGAAGGNYPSLSTPSRVSY